jgi:hypothetical protein
VRLTTGGSTVAGTLVASDEATVTVLPEDTAAPVGFRREAIEELQLSLGRRKNALKGLLIGAVFGVAMGAGQDECLLYSWDYIGEEPPTGCRGDNAALLGAMYALGGLAIGSLVMSDRWKPLDTDTFQVAMTPTPAGRVRAQLSFGF